MKNIRTFRRFLSEGKKENFPDIKKMEIDGFTVYLGKDAKSNDYLTFNVAEDSDLWMHAKGIPGSHVVVSVKDKLPTEATIRKAAEIAKKNSKGKDAENVQLVYCQRRFVKKEPGMKDGEVGVDYVNAHYINI
jgi:predicted ribosome quality control (RQC) complex YloA/Tae2 family protein